MTPWLLPLSTGVHSIRTPFRLDKLDIIGAAGGPQFLIAWLPSNRLSKRVRCGDRVRIVERGDYLGVVETAELHDGIRRLRIRVL